MLALADLPIEIVLLVLEHAARASICSDRKWVVQLALVCRTVYERIRPCLYYALVLTSGNTSHFADVELFERILPFVRSVSIFAQYRGLETAQRLLERWNPPSGADAHIDVAWNQARGCLNRLDSATPVKSHVVSSISVRFEMLHCAVLVKGTRMPPSIARHLKRIVGYMPSSGDWGARGEDFQPSSSREWAQALVDELPSLEAIAFRLVDFDGVGLVALDESYIQEAVGAIKAVLERRSSMRVTLLVGGDYLEETQRVEELFEGLRSTGKFEMWFDRRWTAWDHVHLAEIDDAWARRDIWLTPPPSS